MGGFGAAIQAEKAETGKTFGYPSSPTLVVYLVLLPAGASERVSEGYVQNPIAWDESQRDRQWSCLISKGQERLTLC